MQTPRPVVAVLDDEPEMLKAVRRLLSGRGYGVEEFACGEAFLAALGTRPMDCLLLDLHMDRVSGFDVLVFLQARKTRLPVIVVTAHNEPGVEERVRLLGAHAYLAKPVDRDVLLAAIEDALSRATSPAGPAGSGDGRSP